MLSADGTPMRLTRAGILNRASRDRLYYDLHAILSRILNNSDEYQTTSEYLTVQIHKHISDNQPLLNQRDGEMNCACKIVLDELNKSPCKRNEFKKKHIMKINEKYLSTGIDDEGLQELADKSYMTLVIKDRIGEIWKEFTPAGVDKRGKKLLLISHNNHISRQNTYFENEP